MRLLETWNVARPVRLRSRDRLHICLWGMTKCENRLNDSKEEGVFERLCRIARLHTQASRLRPAHSSI